MINRLPPLAEQEWDVQQRQLAEEIINGPRGACRPLNRCCVVPS
jgi:4-carboxymuconolactone decarboxylase